MKMQKLLAIIIIVKDSSLSNKFEMGKNGVTGLEVPQHFWADNSGTGAYINVLYEDKIIRLYGDIISVEWMLEPYEKKGT